METAIRAQSHRTGGQAFQHQSFMNNHSPAPAGDRNRFCQSEKSPALPVAGRVFRIYILGLRRSHAKEGNCIEIRVLLREFPCSTQNGDISAAPKASFSFPAHRTA
jgi:hypothetical protein